MKRKIIYGALAGTLVLAGALGVVLYTENVPAPLEHGKKETLQVENITLTIEGVYEKKLITVHPGTTLLEVLHTLNANDSQLQLSTKEYAGMGTLVTGMHGKENGTEGKYWQYMVNGVMPQIGAGAYKVQSGDSIEWLFSPSMQ